MQLQLSKVDFRRGGLLILGDINLTLQEGHHYCLIGPNGAGKTTLLSLLTGTEWPSSGTAVFADAGMETPTAHAKSRFGYFFPRHAALIEAHHPEITALELITTGLHQALGYYTPASIAEFDRARALFREHLTSIPEDAVFATMSTGERFRLLLLRSLIAQPDLLVLDEPFDGLDLPSRLDFEKLIATTIRDYARISLTVLHRIEEIPPFITDLILLKEGRILACGEKREMLTGPNLTDLYSLKLVCREHGGRYYVLHGE